jgi:hypothetical protein
MEVREEERREGGTEREGRSEGGWEVGGREREAEVYYQELP